MMRTKSILLMCCLSFMAAVPSFAQAEGGKTVVLGEEMASADGTKEKRLKNRLIVPKGEFQVGLSAMYADLSSRNSDYMLLLQGLDASANMYKVAPQVSYTFADNHSVGLRFQYSTARGMMDSGTADLLGNFSMALEDVNAVTSSMGASVYQRTYIGLDKFGRVGVFWDYVLGLTGTRSQFYTGEQSQAYSLKKKYHLGFAPGIVFFPMNNVSIQASICLADVSYSDVTAYDGDKIVGSRNAWRAQASLNVLDLNFGLTIHL